MGKHIKDKACLDNTFEDGAADNAVHGVGDRVCVTVTNVITTREQTRMITETSVAASRGA